MRQGQHSKRARGRGRKPQNVNRTFESNGPDVKIRGTAATIAEKYLSLARDAQASGDPVASENYLQHAEHYFRIIAAAQAYAQSQHQSEQPQVMNGYGNDGADDEREARLGASGGSNGSHGGERPGQSARADQAPQDDGDDGGDGRARRGRGRRGRRTESDDAPEKLADAVGGGETQGDEPDSNTDTTVVAEAG